jgi:hypothetical protein
MLPVWDLQNRFSLHKTSAENAQAITKLEEVVFWANAGLARFAPDTNGGNHVERQPGQNRTM